MFPFCGARYTFLGFSFSSLADGAVQCQVKELSTLTQGSTSGAHLFYVGLHVHAWAKQIKRYVVQFWSVTEESGRSLRRCRPRLLERYTYHCYIISINSNTFPGFRFVVGSPVVPLCVDSKRSVVPAPRFAPLLL